MDSLIGGISVLRLAMLECCAGILSPAASTLLPAKVALVVTYTCIEDRMKSQPMRFNGSLGHVGKDALRRLPASCDLGEFQHEEKSSAS